ncbi:hypothetical protein NA56DRAFT_754248 [Hyaloscypha hepaticicola]|uniref:Uncharacterized protein n=1 Tax=Hyaloscypha hepaticicola TaxID=2082293 RepID=A0A2J6PLU9_9HELO|nr:hypothetical protein NA56DRAFT_754248 [Hyaloscypha hepaticicola]
MASLPIFQTYKDLKGIASLVGLKGNMLGSFPSTLAGYFVEELLASAGLKPTDYAVVSHNEEKFRCFFKALNQVENIYNPSPSSILPQASAAVGVSLQYSKEVWPVHLFNGTILAPDMLDICGCGRRIGCSAGSKNCNDKGGPHQSQ